MEDTTIMALKRANPLINSDDLCLLAESSLTFEQAGDLISICRTYDKLKSLWDMGLLSEKGMCMVEDLVEAWKLIMAQVTRCN